MFHAGQAGATHAGSTQATQITQVPYNFPEIQPKKSQISHFVTSRAVVIHLGFRQFFAVWTGLYNTNHIFFAPTFPTFPFGGNFFLVLFGVPQKFRAHELEMFLIERNNITGNVFELLL